jgi:hypothetical protein
MGKGKNVGIGCLGVVVVLIIAGCKRRSKSVAPVRGRPSLSWPLSQPTSFHVWTQRMMIRKNRQMLILGGSGTAVQRGGVVESSHSWQCSL